MWRAVPLIWGAVLLIVVPCTAGATWGGVAQYRWLGELLGGWRILGGSPGGAISRPQAWLCCYRVLSRCCWCAALRVLPRRVGLLLAQAWMHTAALFV